MKSSGYNAVPGLLDQIQKLQFADKSAAELLLLTFVQETFPQLPVKHVTLRPLAVSLNSFNGFLQLEDGEQLFFKTHTEPDGIVGEYYRAEQLALAGYPILQPLLQSTEAGKQFLIYPYITAPSVFDVAWEIEQGDPRDFSALEFAQHRLDEHLLGVYLDTLRWQTSEATSQAPIHQLFYHRLTAGRLDRFYGQQGALEPVGSLSLNFAQMREMQWQINGAQYHDTVANAIERATAMLAPSRSGPSIVGHGDAHNGNVFFHTATSGQAHLSYFDPAFAGRHHPLLDLTKPVFHNVFCMWMYFPTVKDSETRFSAAVRNHTIIIEHDYRIAPIRHMFLRSKIERTLIPILTELKRRNWLEDNWREFFKAALFCCPLLTRNLLDRSIFPTNITLLGLSQAVEMASQSIGERSLIDSVLDDVARAIG